ncbi:FAD-binding oxidoreductase [Sulfitobacter sp. F26169L]|uniref:FAD-binding oxidoreductase n=1 Tax=Sulfitobacter sp. F26169L TaxID=2996015 RepID=UPI002260E343|nr:FAD-binding oxidoreductase [Sulfitobacter sp. F26169L]MCX7568120.1 FAD-binding oxidoreductase [Sulfitobacter sp. F26169L]
MSVETKTESQHDLSGFLADIEGIRTSTDAGVIKARSLDYYWYSPLLKEQLADKRADVIVTPRTQDEVVRVAAAIARHAIPVTIRGGGTGNYGQCVPMEGGVVLDITGLNKIIEIGEGWARTQAGARIARLDDACAETGQQLLMYPSTRKIATIGGFLSGGSGGIGSLRHGVLRDDGNVRMVKVLTIEEEPQIITLEGPDIQKVQHAYGTNGIILELEVALTKLTDWIHTAALFDGYIDALQFSLDMLDAGLDCYLLTVVERRFSQYYAKFGELFPDDRDAVFAMVAPDDMERFTAEVERRKGRVPFAMTLEEIHDAGLPPAFECGWNHTTLMALKADPDWTYLQVAYPQPIDPSVVAKQMERYGDQMFWHHEIARMHGEVQVFALPIIRQQKRDDIYKAIAEIEADGCTIYDPHVITIEDGGMKEIDTSQIDFKKQADPYGLMNPGKTRGWTADMARQR